MKYEKLKLEGKVIIVGNLPFNVSTQLLFKWLDTKQWPPFYNRMVLMFQKKWQIGSSQGRIVRIMVKYLLHAKQGVKLMN